MTLCDLYMASSIAVHALCSIHLLHFRQHKIPDVSKTVYFCCLHNIKYFAYHVLILKSYWCKPLHFQINNVFDMLVYQETYDTLWLILTCIVVVLVTNIYVHSVFLKILVQTFWADHCILLRGY